MGARERDERRDEEKVDFNSHDFQVNLNLFLRRLYFQEAQKELTPSIQ